MNFIIRKAQLSDAAKINYVMKLAFKNYEKSACYNAAKGALTEEVSKTLEDIQNKFFLVAESDGEILGSVRVEFDNTNAYLSRFSVLPEYHKYGVGKALLNEVDNKMLKENIHAIILHTSFDVKHLINFYKNNGFNVESISEDTGYKRARLRKIYGSLDENTRI